MEEEVESIVNKQQQQEKDHMEIEQMNMEEKCEEHMEEKCKDEMEEGEQCGEQQCEEEQCEQQCEEEQCEEEQCEEEQCEQQCGEEQCEEWVCRVCHGESDDEHPLFHPCKCSGSIKYVHQDCLLVSFHS